MPLKSQLVCVHPSEATLELGLLLPRKVLEIFASVIRFIRIKNKIGSSEASRRGDGGRWTNVFADFSTTLVACLESLTYWKVVVLADGELGCLSRSPFPWDVSAPLRLSLSVRPAGSPHISSGETPQASTDPTLSCLKSCVPPCRRATSAEGSLLPRPLQ